MWDSLESIWLAAKEDETCEAYVVPIPYFDRNPAGSFGQMHYEGEKYPAYVPITSWQNYDLESSRPDVIYIHNPYDAWNFVTSVHPDYYAEKLQNFAEKLVYAPYFVLEEIDPDDLVVVDGMKGFCFLPGTIYANRVVVQSESMRQIYISEYRKAARKCGLFVEEKQLEEKFLGIGSPKFDKALSTEVKDLEIPKKRAKIISIPDGTYKKVVFYNTSIASLLTNNENWIVKIELILKFFEENEQQIALLWRPHPLIESTIKAMRIEIWEKYEKLKAAYLEGEGGIYDDSVDINRAVAISWQWRYFIELKIKMIMRGLHLI